MYLGWFWICFVAKDNHELLSLPPPPDCRDCRYVLYLISFSAVTQTQGLGMPGKHCANCQPQPLLLFILGAGLTIEPRLALNSQFYPTSWVLGLQPGLHPHSQPLEFIPNPSWPSGHRWFPALVFTDDPSLSLNFHLDFVPKTPRFSYTLSHHDPYLKSLFSLVFPQPLAKHTLGSHLYHLHPKTPPQIQSAEVTVARFQLYPPPQFYASSYLRFPPTPPRPLLLTSQILLGTPIPCWPFGFSASSHPSHHRRNHFTSFTQRLTFPKRDFAETANKSINKILGNT